MAGQVGEAGGGLQEGPDKSADGGLGGAATESIVFDVQAWVTAGVEGIPSSRLSFNSVGAESTWGVTVGITVVAAVTLLGARLPTAW